MIVDASALLAIILDEPDKPRFEEALAMSSGAVFMSPVNYVEAFMRLSRFDRSDFVSALERLISVSEITLDPVTAEQAELARKAHETYGKGRHPARLNLGDCFAYALAKSRRRPLLFKGDDFRQTDIKAAL